MAFRALFALQPFVNLETFIASLPIVPIQDLPHDEKDCSICMSAFRSPRLFDIGLSGEQTDVPVRLRCNHVLGRHCLTLWLSTNATCPLCRHRLSDQPIQFLRDPAMVDQMMADAVAARRPRSQERATSVPRDSGAVTRFADITNYLFGTRFPAEPAERRGTDNPAHHRGRDLSQDGVMHPNTGPRIRRGELQALVNFERVHGIHGRPLPPPPPPAERVRVRGARPVASSRRMGWRYGAARAQGPVAAQVPQQAEASHQPRNTPAAESARSSATAAHTASGNTLVRRTAQSTSRNEPYTVPARASSKPSLASLREEDGNGGIGTVPEHRVTRAMSKRGNVALNPGL